MTDLRVTKQQLVNVFVTRYKRLYNHYPSQDIIDRVKDGAILQFDVLENEGLVLVNKQALLKVKKDLEEIIDSDLMMQATKLVGSWVHDRWLGQLSLCLELLEVSR